MRHGIELSHTFHLFCIQGRTVRVPKCHSIPRQTGVHEDSEVAYLNGEMLRYPSKYSSRNCRIIFHERMIRVFSKCRLSFQLPPTFVVKGYEINLTFFEAKRWAALFACSSYFLTVLIYAPAETSWAMALETLVLSSTLAIWYETPRWWHCIKTKGLKTFFQTSSQTSCRRKR